MAFPKRAGQTWHPMMAAMEHDDIARQLFVQSFMGQLQKTIMPANHAVYDRVVKPRFEKENKRAPKDVHEVRKAMLKEPYTQYWSSMKRCAKEMQYESVGPAVERDLPALIARSEGYRTSNRKHGTLMLDPSIQAPRYNTEIEIHAKPGGYHTDLAENDVFAGAEFDRTLYMIGDGHRGADNDAMGVALSAYVKETVPGLAPKKILDMGCTIGSSTLPWLGAYPGAEVYGIDVAAPCLRYAHARAEALGKKVHFIQDDAEHTKFEDESFDIVASHILMHELSLKALHNVYRECYRLLKPGGVMIHCESTPSGKLFNALPLVDQFHADWDTHFQAEPFMTTLRQLDLGEVAAKAGFERGKMFEGQRNNGHRIYAFGARK